MRRKKILFYTMTMIKGGTERTIVNLSNYFIKDYDITIVSNINGPIEYKLDKRVKVISLDDKDKREELILFKIFTKLSFKRTKKLEKVISVEKPDLIIAFLPEPTLRVLSLKKKINIPVVTAIRNHPNSEFKGMFKLIRNYYYKYSDKLLIQDNSFKKYLPKRFENRIATIPNFLSDEFLTTEVLKKEKIIINVSRLEKQKNLGFLINAFSKLDLKYKDYKLIIYGSGSEKKYLEKLIERKRLTSRVFIKEPTNNIKKELNKASLFVLASNYEGMPNALLEAMSQGLPVIATDSSDTIKTIIKNNKNGVIIKKKNKKQLINSIEYLLENKKVCERLSNEAIKVKKIYNKDRIIKKWENVICDEINNK